MSINSPLEKIKRRVEEILNKTFMEYLLTRIVEYHTRSGLRPGCDCSYCLEKRKATVYVGITHMGEVRKFLTISTTYNCYDPTLHFWESGVYLDEDEVKEA